jgi:hypothetical protein
MLKLVFTLDYEIHGNGQGCPDKLMVEPTDRMLTEFERYGAKLTILADVAEILKFREYATERGRDDFHYHRIASQLQDAIRRGHDVQLHLHASYFNSRFERGSWQQNWAEYNFAGLSPERLREVVKIGKEYLESLLQPIDPGYRCHVFRAANWAVSPSVNVVQALVENGIEIDTSVFKYGRREGMVNFDYRTAWSNLAPWRVKEDDICARDDKGRLTEFPIYSEKCWLGAFLTPQRVYRVLVSRLHKFSPGNRNPQVEPGQSAAARPKGLGWLRDLFGGHAWKADFNQCTGRQLIRALRRAEATSAPAPTALPFVLIGHSKLFTRYNQWSLRPLLAYVAARPGRFGFGTFGDFPLDTEAQARCAKAAAA